MREWTGIELSAARDALEGGAAALLGRMLFEFSRLDMALGLCLVWINDGQDLDELTHQVEEESFALRLNRLEKLVMKGSVEGSKKCTVYADWIAAAREIRTTRNDLVHGRWGTDPVKGEVMNVVGLPTSSAQRSAAYSLADLEGILAEMRRLHERLSELRERWPI